LYKNKNIQCDPIVHGGGQEFNLRSGTEDASKIVGLSIAFQKSLKLREQESLRLIEIRDNFIKNIQKEIPEIVVWGDLENRLPNNINLGLPGILSEEMVIRLGEKGFNISHKSSCASEDTDNGSYVLQSLGASSQQSKENIRITMGKRTESKDMNDLILAIKEIYLKYRNVI
jgi:cysteine desulfurase